MEYCAVILYTCRLIYNWYLCIYVVVKVDNLVLTIHFVLDVTVINTSCFQSSFSVMFEQILSAACGSCIPVACLTKACMVQIYALQFVVYISLNDSPFRTKDIPFIPFKILPNFPFTCSFSHSYFPVKIMLKYGGELCSF